MTDTGDAQATGLTEQDAVGVFEALLARDEGDSEEGGDEEAVEGQSDAEEAPDEPEGDEEDDASEGDEDAQPEPTAKTFKVKVEGEEIEVSEEEVVRGYQREADYSRKLNALAEERRAFEAQAQGVNQERETYASLLPVLQAQLEADPYENVDLDALRNGTADDRAEYAAIIADKQTRKESLAAVQAEQQRLDAIARQEQEQRFQAHFQAESQRLLDAVPEWKDPERAKAEREEIVAAAKARGFTEQDFAGITDHRLILLLRDAAAGQRLQASKPKAQAKVDAVKTARPGAASQQPTKVSKTAQLRGELKRTGSERAAAKLFEQFV